MTVSEELARCAAILRFEDLPPNVVHQVKRILLDTLACTFGGYASEAGQIARSVIAEMEGPQESTIIGSGAKTSCLNATLVNGVMLRYLDYNDIGCVRTEPPMRYAGHPSEVIPCVLALGERERSSGKEVIGAIVIGYEIMTRFLDSIRKKPHEAMGWNIDTAGAFVMPFVAGRLLGLTEDQMVNAVGISGFHDVVLGIVEAATEEISMAKNLRFPLAAYNSVLAALLAKKGYTGPRRVFEGQDGFIEVLARGDFDLETLRKGLVSGERAFNILNTGLKSYPADFSNHGHLSATLSIVNEYNIKPEDIKEVKVRTSMRCASHTGDPAKRYPKNKETADHSSYYITAIAIIDRELTPSQYVPEKLRDPRVRNLIDRIVIEGDPELDRIIPAGVVDIITKDGRCLHKAVDFPRGHPLNPMTDEEVQDKFRRMALKHMPEEQVKELINIVLDLDRLEHIGKLMKLTVFPKAERF